ncbi:hypothetical protein [Streptomyces sp. enrichment culture]|uniref:hypothetical protein n=1 Tax=Streptomyces sp. enrichment culture TaxID=1795815 RepID=UPI003F573B94
MKPVVKIGAFAAALAATFGTAYAVGDAVGPVSSGDRPAAHAGHTPGTPEPAGTRTETEPPGGLQISQDGYTLDLHTTRVPAGERTALRFTVRGEDGRPVTEYRREHEKELHLIVASRDLTTFRHLHPARAADGTWSTTADLRAAGAYRVFADFTPATGEENLTLGADLAVTGTYAPKALPAASRTARVDGYTVRLTGSLAPGADSDLTFTVTRDGRPARLQPYLGAYGHLVALRAGDLAYLHVHPHEEAHGTAASGPEVAFSAAAPSAGDYRLFLDFKADGEVRTAAFTVHAGGGSAVPESPAQESRVQQSPVPDEHSDSGHGH